MLFDCNYASSYPLSQSAFERETIRGHVRSLGVPGTYAFNQGIVLGTDLSKWRFLVFSA